MLTQYLYADEILLSKSSISSPTFLFDLFSNIYFWIHSIQS